MPRSVRITYHRMFRAYRHNRWYFNGLTSHPVCLCEICQQLGQAGGGPLTESSTPGRADAVADGEDGIEVVVVNGAGDLALNYPETPDSCLRIKFALAVNVDQMLVGGGVNLVSLRKGMRTRTTAPAVSVTMRRPLPAGSNPRPAPLH